MIFGKTKSRKTDQILNTKTDFPQIGYIKSARHLEVALRKHSPPPFYEWQGGDHSGQLQQTTPHWLPSPEACLFQ